MVTLGDAADALPLVFGGPVVLVASFIATAVRKTSLPLASVAFTTAQVQCDEADNVIRIGAASLAASSGLAAGLAIVVIIGGVAAEATLSVERKKVGRLNGARVAVDFGSAAEVVSSSETEAAEAAPAAKASSSETATTVMASVMAVMAMMAVMASTASAASSVRTRWRFLGFGRLRFILSGRDLSGRDLFIIVRTIVAFVTVIGSIPFK